MQKNNNFRYDINGLRALAVTSVVIFHFSPQYSPGGFSGVDVFFVISGYLMTSIIFKGLALENFSLLNFYISRIKRIVPALAVLTLFLIFLGWFFLSADDYKLLAKHAHTSLTFTSNSTYYKESGYFDSSAYEKWLLHTWSLSVEWQFYIFYPLLLVISNKLIKLKSTRILVVLLAVSSFIFSVYITPINPNFSYFNLTTRAWEMLLGGIAFLYQPNLGAKVKLKLSCIGLFLIILSFFIFSNKTPWPGYLSLLPTLGAYLVILSNGTPKLITANKPVQFIGKCSYSIYLWHWPIVIIGYYLGISTWAYYGIPLSILAGFISYKLIEQNNWNIKKIKNNAILLVVFSWISCYIIYYNDGAGWGVYRQIYTSPKYEYLNKYSSNNYASSDLHKKYRDECNFSDTDLSPKYNGIDSSCISNVKNKGILLWGDSHAQALSYGITTEFPGIPFSQIASSGCTPSDSLLNDTKNNIKISCDLSNQRAMEAAIKLNPRVIIFAQKGNHDKNNYISLITTLRKNNVTSKIIIIGPVPQWLPTLPQVIAGRHFDKSEISFFDSALDTSLLADDSELKKIQLNNVSVISILDKLCKKEVCLAKVDDKNTPLVWDYGHLTLEGSVFIVKNILYYEIKNAL